MIMLFLGILGEYVWRTLDVAQNRPVYFVEEEREPDGSEKNEILAVPNNSDTGEDNWQPSFLKRCFDAGIECVHLHQLYDMEIIFLSLEFNRIIEPENFKFKHLYNMHFSKLSKYRGGVYICLAYTEWGE